MKINFVSQYFHPEQFSNNAIATHLADADHDVAVLTAVPNYPKGFFFEGYSNSARRTEDWRGCHIHRVWTWPRRSGALHMVLNYLTFAITGMWRARFGRQMRGDVVLVSQLSPIFMCLPGWVLARRNRVPLVYWVQDIWPESLLFTLGIKNRIFTHILMAVCGWIYRRADLVLVQSAAFPPMLERFGIPADKIGVLPNTAPATYRPVVRDPDSAIARMMPQRGFRLMFAGNIGESQDFDTYLAAAEILCVRGCDVAWTIIGSGRDLARVQAQVAARDLSDVFHFLGRHPEPDMPEFFAHADAMLVRLKDTPIFAMTVPYKVQCYLACGRPIVGSLSGEGARVIAASGAGICAPAQSPDLLADAIARMVAAAPDARADMATAARDYFTQTYAAEKVYGDLERWLRVAMAQNDGCGPHPDKKA